MMLNVTKIVASRSTRVNTGQYEGTEYFISMEVEIDPQMDDWKEQKGLLEQKLDAAMLDTLHAAHRANGKNVTREAVAKRHGINPHKGT